MDEAIEIGTKWIQGEGKVGFSGSGAVQFIRTFVDGFGRTIRQIVRFDVNPNSGHVQNSPDGPHLNLETQIFDGAGNRLPTPQGLTDPHIPIDPSTIQHPGDYQ